MYDLLAYLSGILIVNDFCGVLNSPNIFMKDIIFFWHCLISIIFPFYQLAEHLRKSKLFNPYTAEHVSTNVMPFWECRACSTEHATF